MNADEGAAVVIAYDVRWPELYAAEAAELRTALGDDALGFEHFGSTSVPGLAAKPIVDILVGVRAGQDPAVLVAALASCGYEYLGEDGRRPGRHFWSKREPDAFNLSAVPFDGDLWRSNVAVRDFLRTHPEWAEAYAAVKYRAASASPGSIAGYQDAKRMFVDDLRTRAEAWFAENEAGVGAERA